MSAAFHLSHPASRRYQVCLKTRAGRIPVCKIIYMEMERHCIQVHTAAYSVKFWGVLEKEAAALRPFGFVRIHKGYVVRLPEIRRRTFSTVELKSGLFLPIGRKYRAERRFSDK